LGYLNGGIEAWVAAGKQIDAIKNIRAEEVVKSKIPIVDVRKPGEFTSEHVDGALHAPLDLINDYLDSFDKEKPFYIHCAGGYRSVIAASILKSRGIHGAINILGGYAALKKTNIKKTDYICPSTLK
jgi:rhodanese-related sulfurtransferase